MQNGKWKFCVFCELNGTLFNLLTVVLFIKHLWVATPNIKDVKISSFVFKLKFYCVLFILLNIICCSNSFLYLSLTFKRRMTTKNAVQHLPEFTKLV